MPNLEAGNKRKRVAQIVFLLAKLGFLSLVESFYLFLLDLFQVVRNR